MSTTGQAKLLVPVVDTFGFNFIKRDFWKINAFEIGVVCKSGYSAVEIIVFYPRSILLLEINMFCMHHVEQFWIQPKVQWLVFILLNNARNWYIEYWNDYLHLMDGVCGF